MKLPKGFGKNYFTLNAITATVAQISLHAIAVRVESFHTLTYKSEELEAEEEIEELSILCPLQFFVKPCHCNCYFFKKTRQILRLFFYKKLFLLYFKTLNSAISPPQINFYPLFGYAFYFALFHHDKNYHDEMKQTQIL